jgi:DNA (cytosine-5)-methyltransferase 1
VRGTFAKTVGKVWGETFPKGSAMPAFYNEIDGYAAAWLRNLAAAGHLPAGTVDERSILDLEPDDLRPFRQCHFFAGIGGWPYALELAGWPDDREVWTGSCPCQPLSSAGQRRGHADERHLWPAFYALIAECRPATVFGEQVASKDGREWLAGVRADLEALGYAIGAADLPAASVAAPHKRNRLFWVADANPRFEVLDQPSGDRWPRRQSPEKCVGNGPKARWPESEYGVVWTGSNSAQKLGDAASAGPQEQRREYRPSGEGHRGLVGFASQVSVPQWNGPTIAVECSDGWRRVSAEPEAFPLATGVSARMGKLRGAGNAIVPQAAAEFIRAFLEK